MSVVEVARSRRPPTKSVQILAAWKRGERDYVRIGELAGTTAHTVRSVLSKAGLLAKEGRKVGRKRVRNLEGMIAAYEAGERNLFKLNAIGGYATTGAARTTLCRLGCYGVIGQRSRWRLPRDLCDEAKRRDVEPWVLARALLGIIARDKLYESVLDGEL